MGSYFAPPWKSPVWKEKAYIWIEEAIDAEGLRLVAEIEPIHIRPWSVVLRVPASSGDFFFKAGAPNQAYEPRLLEFLYQHQPKYSLQPLAVDADRGWVLLPDGGQTLRQHSAGNFSKTAWKKLLAAYAQLQIELLSHAEESLTSKVPDRRLPELVNLYSVISEDEDALLVSEGLSREELKQLRDVAPRFADACAELDAIGLPAGLDHGDLHDANVFVDGDEFVFFDWGDASLTHPFFSLIVPLRVIGNALGFDSENHPDLNWARGAYFEPWQRFASKDAINRAWELALPIGKVQRALTWYTVIKTLDPKSTEEWHAAPARWLREFLEEMPFS